MEAAEKAHKEAIKAEVAAALDAHQADSDAEQAKIKAEMEKARLAHEIAQEKAE